jgi:hypothetical protein
MGGYGVGKVNEIKMGENTLDFGLPIFYHCEINAKTMRQSSRRLNFCKPFGLAVLPLWFLVFCMPRAQAQFSAMRFTHVKKKSGGNDVDQLGTPPVNPIAPAGAGPTLTDFNPKTAGEAKKITITGQHFDPSATVTLGGTQVAECAVISATQIEVLVGEGTTGDVVVTTTQGSATLHNFIFAEAPTITGVSRNPTSNGKMVLTITGTNFIRPAKVQINGTSDKVDAIVLSPTKIQVVFSANSAITTLLLSTLGGDVIYPSSPGTAAGADLNLPNPGNGITIIPTPSFDYSQVISDGWLGFTGRAWGNVLGTDSSRQKVGTKFLSPELSQFGLKVELDARLTDYKKNNPFTASLECNLLWKNVSYFDTSLKQNTNFNPFVIETRLGMVWSVFNDTWFLAAYGNFPAIVGSNNEFATFFKVRPRNVFFYPEFDVGGLIPVSNGGNQALKIQISLLVNNGDVQTIMGTNDGVVIPYIKFGFVSTF